MEVHYNLAMRCIWIGRSWQIRYNIANTMLAMPYVPPGQTHIDRIHILRRIRDCDAVGGERSVLVEAVHVPSPKVDIKNRYGSSLQSGDEMYMDLA